MKHYMIHRIFRQTQRR